MQVLVNTPTTSDLVQLIRRQAHADYVYMYPPRQAYRPFESATVGRLAGLVQDSLARFDELNLYVHVPFCRQICSFCNLYSTVDRRDDLQYYVDAVLTEAASYATHTDRRRIPTLYLGGGTPSLLTPAQIEQVITRLLELFSTRPGDLPGETALEVDPATVDAAKLRGLRAAGVNRINLGYQSMVDQEVRQIGRRRSEATALQLLEEALDAGFSNVCVDLIYGLLGQTDENWAKSVAQVTSLAPPTICAYALTSRPFTAYRQRGYSGVHGEVLYRRFEIVDGMLRSAGYRRETRVRWVRGNGGYQQKVNHWGMQNILGFGAGARSYLWEVDLRNGYSVRSRDSVLQEYLRIVADGGQPASSGFLMDDSERMRKAAALNIHSLDRTWFRNQFGIDLTAAFPGEVAVLQELDLAVLDERGLALTESGIRYRDLIAQYFFSSRVRDLLHEFDYDE